MNTMKIICKSGINGDAIRTVISDGEDTLCDNTYNVGYSVSATKDLPYEELPYIGDVLQYLIAIYNVEDYTVEAGKNTFTNQPVSNEYLEKFKEKHCKDLWVHHSLPEWLQEEFSDAVAAIPVEENVLGHEIQK